MKEGTFLILVAVKDDDGVLGYHDTGEGPWNSMEEAAEYARAEVGFPWIIVQVRSTEGEDGE